MIVVHELLDLVYPPGGTIIFLCVIPAISSEIKAIAVRFAVGHIGLLLTVIWCSVQNAESMFTELAIMMLI